jgi:hypothetical protein
MIPAEAPAYRKKPLLDTDLISGPSGGIRLDLEIFIVGITDLLRLKITGNEEHHQQ